MSQIYNGTTFSPLYVKMEFRIVKKEKQGSIAPDRRETP